MAPIYGDSLLQQGFHSDITFDMNANENANKLLCTSHAIHFVFCFLNHKPIPGLLKYFYVFLRAFCDVFILRNIKNISLTQPVFNLHTFQ